MWIDRRVRVAVAGTVATIILGLAAFAGVRWFTAGERFAVTAPAGASEKLPEGGYEVVVDLRFSEVHQDLRTDRGAAGVSTYVMPPDTSWDQVRSAVADQLDGWKQAGDCLDSDRQRVWCTWTEPARWWPRRVKIVFIRPPTKAEGRSAWPDNTFLVIGSGLGGDVWSLPG
ncbi:hypothetical protein AB0F72_19295 [Actinoplanes sp. NPDC023936]|uniref:hypothetical protein n=1 Tax=Actinoplanes sp. NPDC023936 TaxID=3154910 RepID=UPI0033F0794A